MTCYKWDKAYLNINIRVQTCASRNELVSIQNEQLKIRITAPPVDGKANQQLIKFLAKTFGTKRRNILLLNGEASRNKRFQIQLPTKFPAIANIKL